MVESGRLRESPGQPYPRDAIKAMQYTYLRCGRKRVMIDAAHGKKTTSLGCQGALSVGNGASFGGGARSLSVMTGPESMTGGTSAMYSEVECSFAKRVPLCEPGKCVGLCIGYSVTVPRTLSGAQYSESLSP